MKNLLISLIVSAGLMSAAHAGNVDAGKAKSATCAACHGADGNSLAPTFPKIAGQGQTYLIKQLKDIRDGRRSVPEMTGFVAGLKDADIADIAAYYASQAATGGGADEKLVALGERIYRGGDASRNVPACIACHGPKGEGVKAAGFPHLAGQHADYTKAQLNKFSMNERQNDGDARIMRDIAYRMHATQIEAVASYIQGLR